LKQEKSAQENECRFVFNNRRISNVLNLILLFFKLKENQRAAYHHQREHANLKQQSHQNVKDNYKKISKRACFAIHQKKRNGTIVEHTKPRKKIRRNFPSKNFAYHRHFVVSRKPNFQRQSIDEPIVIDFGKPCIHIHNRNLQFKYINCPSRHLIATFQHGWRRGYQAQKQTNQTNIVVMVQIIREVN